MDHTIYKSEFRKAREAKARRRFEIARNIFIAIILLACFLGASYADHQALQMGLIN